MSAEVQAEAITFLQLVHKEVHVVTMDADQRFSFSSIYNKPVPYGAIAW